MDFSFSAEQQQIRDAILKLCAQFDDDYWLAKDRSGDFPHELHSALAAAGWLGLAMPPEHVTEAAIMMQAIAESGAAMSGASAVHMNIFGLLPVVVLGTHEQKGRMLPPLIAGKDRACFAVTEPNTGLDTTAIKVRAERRGDDYVLTGQKIWISTAQIANKVLILARTTPSARPRACLFSTPISTAAALPSASSRRWAATRLIPTKCFSTAWSFLPPIALARRERDLPPFSTA
jgi:acyl-CoA dehydrogenase